MLDKEPSCRRCTGAAMWYFSHKHALKAASKVTPLSFGTIQLADLLGPMKTLLDAGGEVRLEAGELVVTRSAAQEVPAGAQALQQEIGRRLPAVDLTDILVEVNAWLGFTAHLPGLEHAPRGDKHDTRLLATLLATGCNIPLAGVAR